MRAIYKGCIAALVIIGMLACTGCNMVSVNKEKDEAQVVATVNGVEIPKKDFYDNLNAMLMMYGMSTQDIQDSETQQELLESVLDEVVGQEALYQQAKEDGFVDESDENIQKVKEEIQEQLDSTLESYKESSESEEAAQEKYDEYVRENGYDDLDQKAREKIRQDGISEEYKKVTDPITVSDDEAKEYFDEQVETQKEAIEEDPSSYSLYSSQGQAFYNPPDSVYVKNLLIALPEDVQQEISSLRTAGNTEEADALRDEELAKIKAEADTALERANAGEDFTTLIEELGDDPGMSQEPAATYGYMVYEGSNFVDAFEAASLALNEDGQISELIPTDFGYHIIERVQQADGPVPFDSVKDSIVQSQTSSKQSTAYTDYVEELKNGMDIVLYTDRLQLYD